MEDYKQKYEEALENIKRIKAANKDNKELVDFIEYKYPELKESEDERIRKWIYNLVSNQKKIAKEFLSEEDVDIVEQALAWLEKQSKPQVRTGIEWVNAIDDACEHRYGSKK